MSNAWKKVSGYTNAALSEIAQSARAELGRFDECPDHAAGLHLRDAEFSVDDINYAIAGMAGDEGESGFHVFIVMLTSGQIGLIRRERCNEGCCCFHASATEHISLEAVLDYAKSGTDGTETLSMVIKLLDEKENTDG